MNSKQWFVVGAVFVSVAAGGCFAMDWDFAGKVEGSGGAGGSPSSSASTAQSTSSGMGAVSSSSSASSSGSSGIVSNVPCAGPEDCGDACGTPKCSTGYCMWTGVVPAGPAPKSKQTYGDCKNIKCTAIGQPLVQDDMTDKYVWSNPCFVPDCLAGKSMPTYVDIGTTCDKWKVCDADGRCGDCAINGDCGGGDVCQKGLCVWGSCTNGVWDQSFAEKDVDCGGGGCRPCGVGSPCYNADGCESMRCTGPANQTKCTASCVDGAQNQTETDVDCGGVCVSAGLACATGKVCLYPTDCVSSHCVAGVCE